MAVTIIDNQAIRFRLTTVIDADVCACSYKPFCQKVNKFDISKYQIISSNLVTNGEFADSLDGWVIGQSLTVSLTLTNESAEDACDGEIQVNVTGGTGPYEYSKDGTTFQLSDTFTGLCAGCYNIVVRDSLGNLGFASGCVATNVDCGSFSSPDLFDLKDVDLSNLINCYLNDLI